MKVEKIMEKQLDKYEELSNFQKRICRWFNIPQPEPKYFVTLLVNVDNVGDIMVGDFISGNNTWRVLFINDSGTNVRISSVQPISDYEENYLRLNYRAFAG